MRYFFKLTDGDSYDDNHGTELVDQAAAEAEAAKIAGEWLRDNPETFQRDRVLKVEVLDGDKALVATVVINLERRDNVQPLRQPSSAGAD